MVNLVDDRLKLHEKLKEIISNHTGDSKNRVWFKKNSNVSMVYPCIVYSRSTISSRHADNIRYFSRIPYELILMDLDSDSEIASKILEEIPTSQLTNEYTNDGIYHYVITIPNGSLI